MNRKMHTCRRAVQALAILMAFSANTVFAVKPSYLDTLNSEAEELGVDKTEQVAEGLDMDSFAEELAVKLPDSYSAYIQLDEKRRERVFNKYLSDNSVKGLERYIEKQKDFLEIQKQRVNAH